MSIARQLTLSLKALRQLGPRQVGWYTWYQLGLHSGYLRRVTPEGPFLPTGSADWRSSQPTQQLLPAPAQIKHLLGRRSAGLFSEADEIVAGNVRLFGGAPVPLQLTSPGRLAHWTDWALEAESGSEEDIKFTWEPGRFGWVFTLSRAYHLARDERYAEAFWRHSEIFLGANPPNLGAQWVSGQEVALRLMALVFGLQIFAASPHSTEPRLRRLDAAIAAHAARIPPTLAYARAQNNNHLLSEAAGLITAGTFLPNHPSARRWQKLGWEWLNRGLCSQIQADGTYTQHSANYHRLMLQIALWVAVLDRPFPTATLERLASAARWLAQLVDPLSGRAPNLGPNDGTHFLPLSTCPFDDYRPTVQAAWLAFLGERAYPAGPWDELALWLGMAAKPAAVGNSEDSDDSQPKKVLTQPGEGAETQAPTILRASSSSWAYLRATRFYDRPGHADQLHLDLWWRGLNIAQDAGTYLYNGRPPWDNPLPGTAFHNTVMVNKQEQMRRAGKFLWLDWAQAKICPPVDNPGQKRLSAEHDGYRRQGVIHRRTVSARADGSWVVEDELLPAGKKPAADNTGKNPPPGPGEVGQPSWSARLHWLLPNWEWEMEKNSQDSRESGVSLRLKSPFGWVQLAVSYPKGTEISAPRASLCRAGEILFGEALAEPTRGWFSPTYGYKFPALSFAIETDSTRLPLSLQSLFMFPEA